MGWKISYVTRGRGRQKVIQDQGDEGVQGWKISYATELCLAASGLVAGQMPSMTTFVFLVCFVQVQLPILHP